MTRKKLVYLLLSISIVYLSSVIYRGLEFVVEDTYSFDKAQAKRNGIYPILFVGYKGAESRLQDKNQVLITDYGRVKNLSKSSAGIQYNPINISFVLVHELSWIARNDLNTVDRSLALANLNWLVENQSEQGFWQLNFDNHISRRVNKAPWHSGLAQGLSISALVQGYELFGDNIYLEAALKGYQAMQVPVSQAGTLSGTDYGPVFEEYPFVEKNIHVLNGYMYSIISLLQLSKYESSARVILEQHLSVLDRMLPDYRLPLGWSAYSLDTPTLRNHLTYANPTYHDLHVSQLEYLCWYSNLPNVCKYASDFESDKMSIASFLVSFAYVAFRDVITVYKSLP